MSNADEMQLDSQLAWLLSEGMQYLDAPENGVANAKRRLTQWQRALLEQQAQFRKRSRRRFPDPQQWLWTDRSLAQASDWWSASYKARYFESCSDVIDACSGAGVDAIALAKNSRVTAIDFDPTMCALARANAKIHQRDIDFRCEAFDMDAASHLAGLADSLHIDPDRRPGERRTNDSDQFSPALEDVLRCAELFQSAMIKLACSTRMNAALANAVDEQTTRVWLGNMGECRQQLLLAGQFAATEKRLRRAVLAEPLQDSSDAGPVSITEFEASPLGFANSTLSPQRFVFDLHSVLHAAELHTAWAAAHGLQQVGGEHGYFTGSAAMTSPWAQCFEFVEVLPWDDRRIRKWLRSVKPGVVEVKNRLVRMDANVFQKRYSGTGEESLTLLVTQLGDRTQAIAARRV